jgi:hypothetical protein
VVMDGIDGAVSATSLGGAAAVLEIAAPHAHGRAPAIRDAPPGTSTVWTISATGSSLRPPDPAVCQTSLGRWATLISSQIRMT